MATKITGTNAFTGLNVKSAPALIRPDELQESRNGWTDRDGQWNVARQPERLYSGTSIVAYAAGRMDGADHHIYLDGTTLYDNGVSVGTITGATDDMQIKAIDDGFLILGAPKNYIYDGDHVREQGAWQPDYLWSVNEQRTWTGIGTIADITEGAPTVITLAANYYGVGDRVLIDGITTGATALNGRYFTVDAVAGNTITINEDTTGAVNWSAGGTVEPASDLTGVYRFYAVPLIKLTDGTVIKGEPRGLKIETVTTLDTDEYDLGPSDQTEPSELTLSAGDTIQVGQGHTVSAVTRYFLLYFTKAGVDLFDISGTAGTDYWRGVRIYRTKQNGYDAYVEREYFEGDDRCAAFTIGTDSGIEVDNMYLGVPDIDLGAVLDYSFTDHISAPQSDLAAFVGQRVFLADGDKLWWSLLDGVEYYGETSNTEMFDTITALGAYQDYCIVFSSDRIWAVRIISGIPEIEEIRTAVGTVWPKPVIQTSVGLMFLRPDGLYAVSGGQVEKVSRLAFDNIIDPQSLTQAGDVLYLSGSEQAFIALNRGDGWTWHESDHYLPYSDQTSGTLYGANQFSVSEMFVGARTDGTLKTKEFGGLDLSMTYKLEIDIEGDSIPHVWVNGNVVSDTAWHPDDTAYDFPGRRIVWTYLPQLLSNYVNVQMEVTGDVTVYGMSLVQER